MKRYCPIVLGSIVLIILAGQSPPPKPLPAAVEKATTEYGSALQQTEFPNGNIRRIVG